MLTCGMSVGLLLPLIVIAQFTTTEAGLDVCPSVDRLRKGGPGSRKKQDLGLFYIEKVQLQARDLRKGEKCSRWVRS